MAMTPLNPEPARNRPETGSYTPPTTPRSTSNVDDLDPETRLARLGIWRAERETRDERAAAGLAAFPAEALEETQESDRLKSENEELRAIVIELRGLLDEASARGHEPWAEREREYESMLEQKSEVIRSLHLKLHELEHHQPEARPGANVPNERDLLELSDELDRERAHLEQERRQFEEVRRQFKDDEDAMMQQMREMEMQMSRERAELARQRNELQRLHNEIRHELESAQRDSLVNERLRMLQRKHQEATTRRPGEPEPPPQSGETPPKKDSGLLRGLFRRKGN